MKIVQINTYDISGGAARAAYRLYQGLLKIGEDCRVLVKYKASRDDSVFGITPINSAEKFSEEFFLGTVIQGYYIDSHRTDISNSLFSLPYPGYDLSALPLVQAADIVNLHWVAYYQSPFTLSKLFALGKPVVWTLHDQWAFTGGCHYAAGCEKYRQDCAACLQLADDPFNLPAAVLRDKIDLFRDANLTIVTPSRWLAACARESRLFKDFRVGIIPYSLDTDVFSPLPKAKAKESVGLAAETITLLFSAHLGNEKRKGFRELRATIRFCLKDAEFQELVKNDKIRLLCFGYPSDELEALGIPVVSLGYLDSDEDIRAAYAAADIFVLPSLEDNLPNTMLESMSCGTPVVAFDVGGIPDVVVNGVTGQLAPVGDIRKLGEAILSLVFDPDQRGVMGQNCRKVMVEGYSLTVQAQRYLELYQELHQEYKLSAQVMSEDSILKLDQTEVPVAAPAVEASPVYLETTVGPHFQAISNQVLFKTLKEFAPAREKDYQAARERLQQYREQQEKYIEQLKQQGQRLQQYREQQEKHIEQLKQQGEQLELQNEQLKQQGEQLKQQGEQLKQQGEQLQRLAAENRNLNLQVSQLRNSWSWKITEPLRKVGALGIAVRDAISGRGRRPCTPTSGDVPTENPEEPKSEQDL
jgi:glycosyltransferase involved in cell wall biosynthesis